jgi:hypothetical protein
MVIERARFERCGPPATPGGQRRGRKGVLSAPINPEESATGGRRLNRVPRRKPGQLDHWLVTFARLCG